MGTQTQKRNQLQHKSSTNLAGSNTARAASHEAHPLLNLQHTIGNQAVSRLLAGKSNGVEGFASAPMTIQPKLVVTTPGDSSEQEADHISEHVMRMPEPKSQRVCACVGGCAKCQMDQPSQEHQQLQPKQIGPRDSGQIVASPSVHQVLASSGQPLDTSARAFFEPRFHHDLSQVRVHLGAIAEQSARDVNAHAYTVGDNIVFGAGRFVPGTADGQRLLAHELAHVVQQSGDGVALMRDAAPTPYADGAPDRQVSASGALLQRDPDSDSFRSEYSGNFNGWFSLPDKGRFDYEIELRNVPALMLNQKREQLDIECEFGVRTVLQELLASKVSLSGLPKLVLSLDAGNVKTMTAGYVRGLVTKAVRAEVKRLLGRAAVRATTPSSATSTPAPGKTTPTPRSDKHQPTPGETVDQRLSRQADTTVGVLSRLVAEADSLGYGGIIFVIALTGNEIEPRQMAKVGPVKPHESGTMRMSISMAAKSIREDVAQLMIGSPSEMVIEFARDERGIMHFERAARRPLPPTGATSQPRPEREIADEYGLPNSQKMWAEIEKKWHAEMKEAVVMVGTFALTEIATWIIGGAVLKILGAGLVRLPRLYRLIRGGSAGTKAIEEGLARLSKAEAEELGQLLKRANAGESLGAAEVKRLEELATRLETELASTTAASGKLSSGQIGGDIIGWGTGQTAEAAEQTLAVTKALTRGKVSEMIGKGLTREWVVEQLGFYTAAVAKGEAKLKNNQLFARKELMERILSLWPES